MVEWLKNYKHDLNIKKMIILYGNIHDYVYDKFDYTANIKKALDILEKNEKKTIKYNFLTGIDFGTLDESIIYEIISNVNKDRYSLYNGLIVVKTNVRNRRNNFETNGNVSIPVENNMTNMDIVKQDFKNFSDFAALIYNNSKEDLIPINYFIEVGDGIFGKIRSDEVLNEFERRIYYNLINATYNFKNSQIIINVDNLSTIPRDLYLNNPYVSKIFIPLPSRSIRREYFDKKRYNFNIKTSEENEFIDSLDGMSLIEMKQIGILTKLEENLNKSYKDILSQYKYGCLKNAWNELDKNKLLKIKEILKIRVKGQNEAIDKVGNILVKAYTGISGIGHSLSNKKPKGILFFVGPTGVGKTELAKSIAEFVFGDEESCIRFDMSEYNSEHSDQKLIGAPPGYIGYEAGGQLTNKIKEKPFSVILFDEIEKAHNKILDKFLQILEDGRLTDGKGETVYFSESIIIFTSNIGTDKIDSNESDSNFKFKNSVVEYFNNILKRPEILNRIGLDNIITFNFITDYKIFIEIVKSKIENINKFLKEKYENSKIEIKNIDNTLYNLVSNSNINYGARGALNDMEKYLIDPLSIFLFKNDISNSIILAKYNKKESKFNFEVIK